MEKVIEFTLIKEKRSFTNFKAAVNKILPFLYNDIYGKKKIGIYYNIEQNGYYYRVNDDYNYLRKDLSRSIEMVVEIMDRLRQFDFKVENIDNHINWFVRKIIDSYTQDQATYLLIGSNGYKYEKLSNLLIKLIVYDKSLDGSDRDVAAMVFGPVNYMQENLNKSSNYNITFNEVPDQFE